MQNNYFRRDLDFSDARLSGYRTANRHITGMTFTRLHHNDFNDQDEISGKAMGHSWWMELALFFFFFQHK